MHAVIIAVGDATLRSFMNWDDVKNTNETKKILTHWQKTVVWVAIALFSFVYLVYPKY